LVLDLHATRPFVNGDRGQIHQALLNLSLNARDAIPGGGTLTVATRDHDGGGEFAGPAVVVAVRDTGVGIPADIQETIFEPFFTTKPKGRGSGMGLAIVSRVVKNHRGAILVTSRPGEGAEFRVYVPARSAQPPL
jgi:signal transduction histidine kinase